MLAFAQFRFRLSLREPLCLPARNKGNVLRGALGTMLRRLCCQPQCPGAVHCELRATCPYAQVFEPAAPPGARALSNYEAIPRPFVIRPPLAEQTRYAPEEILEFGLILVGRSIEWLPYFVLAFEQLGEEGFGLNRARCRLDRVEQIGLPPSAFSSQPTAPAAPAQGLVFDSVSRTMRQPWRPEAWDSAIRNPHFAIGKSEIRNPKSEILLRFLTPTHLVFEERAVREPEFHHLVCRLRDRLNALATFYCDGPLDLDFSGLAERARAVRCLRRDLRWEQRERRSARTGRRHAISGFLGECVFAAPSPDALAEFLPLLHLGQFLHVGKHTAWGHGWFVML